jgi:hypothetical protein
VLGVGVLTARVVGAELPAGELGVPDEQAASASMAEQREPDTTYEIREVVISPKTAHRGIRLAAFRHNLTNAGSRMAAVNR